MTPTSIRQTYSACGLRRVFTIPQHYHAYLLQGGLELPDREYYLGDSAQMKEIQAKYQAHVTAMFRLAGFDDADVRAHAGDCSGKSDRANPYQSGGR